MYILKLLGWELMGKVKKKFKGIDKSFNLEREKFE